MKKVLLANIIGFSLFIVLAFLGILDVLGVIELPVFIGFHVFIVFLLDIILFFVLLYYIPDSWIKRLLKISGWFSTVIVSLFIGIKLYEWITGTIFIYSFRYQYFYLILVIYPTIMTGFFYLRSRAVRDTQKVLHSVLVGSVAIVLILIHTVFLVLGSELTTPIYFEEQDRKVLLVESSFLFSSTHRLLEYDNALFVKPLESEGSFTCHDGCVIGHPEYFTFTWVDDNTLEITGSALYNTVTYYFEEK